jgi:hypothetical protein
MNDKRYSLFERRCIQIGGFRLEMDGSCYYGAINAQGVYMQEQAVGNDLSLFEG